MATTPCPPANQITSASVLGVTDGSDALPGFVGEYLWADSPADLTLTSQTPADLCSLTLPAGDWDVVAGAGFNNPSGTLSQLMVMVSMTSGSAVGEFASNSTLIGFEGTSWATGSVIATPPVRVSVAVPTPVFCVARAMYTGSPLAASGMLRARRIR